MADRFQKKSTASWRRLSSEDSADCPPPYYARPLETESLCSSAICFDLWPAIQAKLAVLPECLAPTASLTSCGPPLRFVELSIVAFSARVNRLLSFVESLYPLQMTTTNFTEGFPDRLRLAREGCGLSQRELGAEAGVNFSQISRYEQGIATPRPGVLKKLAEVLGTSIEHLRDGQAMERVSIYFGDDEEPLMTINVSESDMQFVREAALKSGRTVDEEMSLMFKLGISFLNKESAPSAVGKKRTAKPEKH